MRQSANSQMQVLLQFRAVDTHFVCAKEGCRDSTPMLQFIAVFETLAVRARGQEWCKLWLVAPITGGGTQGSTAAATCMATSLCRRWFKCCHRILWVSWSMSWRKGAECGWFAETSWSFYCIICILKSSLRFLKWDIEGHGVMDFNKGSVQLQW